MTLLHRRQAVFDRNPARERQGVLSEALKNMSGDDVSTTASRMVCPADAVDALADGSRPQVRGSMPAAAEEIARA